MQARSLLLVGPGEKMRREVGATVEQAWPAATIDYYDSQNGQPDRNFPVRRYDGVLIAHDLDLQAESGLTWLREMAAFGGLPSAVLLTDSSESIVSEIAVRYGALACLRTDQLSVDNLLSAFAGNADPGDNPNAVKRSKSDSGADIHESPARPNASGADSSDENGDECTLEVPGYRVEDFVAQGGMSGVYRAIREGDSATVALKVLKLGEEYDQELIQRFMKEFAAVARMSHPNVISIEERGFSSDFAYIAMEYCPAGDLKVRLQLGLSPREVISYARQIAQGLGAAHKCGLVHRDVKPSNMLFREDGTLVVSDFGVAKDTADLHRSMTEPMAVVGTVYYASPEQIRGDPVDARSDLYGLGGVIFQMLTGRPPFIRNTRADLLDAHLTAPLPTLEDKHAVFQKLIDGLLAKDADDRFQSAEEVIEGLNWIEQSLGQEQVTRGKVTSPLKSVR